MSARDEFQDPWGWLVAAVSGGVGWAVLATPLGPAAIPVGIGIGAAVLGAKVGLGAARKQPEEQPASRDLLPQAPPDSRQADLLVRSRLAVRRIDELAGRTSDPWMSGEVQEVLGQSSPVLDAIEEMSGRLTVLDTSIRVAAPHALADEIAALQERMRHTSDPGVLREQEHALAALDAQADSIDRMLRRRDSALAQMLATAVGLEGLAARVGELVSLGPAHLDTQEAGRVVAGLTDSLEAVQAGVDQARKMLREP